VLFQIVDDILDVTGSDADLGKPHGSDARLGKLTYVSAYGVERARELDGRETTVVDAMQLIANDLGMVESMLRRQAGRRAA